MLFNKDPKKMIDDIISKTDKDGDGIKDHQEKIIKGKDVNPVVKKNVLKKIWTPIRETLSGENGLGKGLGLAKDLLKNIIPYGNIIDKATDIIGDQLKTKEDSKTMITLKHPKTTITGLLLLIASVLKLFFGVDSENWDFEHIAESAVMFLTGSGLIFTGDGSKPPSG